MPPAASYWNSVCEVCRYKTFIYMLAMRLPEFFFYLCHWPVEWPWTNHCMILASVLSSIKFRHWWGDHRGSFSSNIPWPTNFKPHLKKAIVTSLTKQNTYLFHRSQLSQRWRGHWSAFNLWASVIRHITCSRVCKLCLSSSVAF